MRKKYDDAIKDEKAPVVILVLTKEQSQTLRNMILRRAQEGKPPSRIAAEVAT